MKKCLVCVMLVMLLSGCINVKTDTTYETRYIVNGDNVKLREKDKNSGEVITRINYGEAVSYIKDAKNGYAKVVYNGETGYVPAVNLSEEKPVKETEWEMETVFVEDSEEHIKAVEVTIMTDADIEEYVKYVVRPIYYEINEDIDSFKKMTDMEKTLWYDGNNCVKKEFNAGTNSWDITRQYYYDNDKLLFAFIFEKGTEYRLYFKDDRLVRFIDTDGAVYNNPGNLAVIDMAENVLKECY